MLAGQWCSVCCGKFYFKSMMALIFRVHMDRWTLEEKLTAATDRIIALALRLDVLQDII